eukprot:6041445-Pleurochrysis_carterae.AAC.1
MERNKPHQKEISVVGGEVENGDRALCHFSGQKADDSWHFPGKGPQMYLESPPALRRISYWRCFYCFFKGFLTK